MNFHAVVTCFFASLEVPQIYAKDKAERIVHNLFSLLNQLLSQKLSIFRFLERIRLCLTHHRSCRCTQVCCWLQRILSVSAQVSHWQLPGYVSYKHILGVRSFFRFPDVFLNIGSELVAKPQTEWSSFDNLFALAISKNSAMYVIVSF